MSRKIITLVAVAAIVAVAAGPAQGQPTESGGLLASDRPHLKSLKCPGKAKCARGAELRIRGEHLDDVREVVFLGSRGAADDRRAVPMSKTPKTLTVTIPDSATKGGVTLESRTGERSGSRRLSLRSAPAATPPTDDGASGDSSLPLPGALPGDVFPIRGSHDYGRRSVNGFGGKRKHKGQDVFASCGTTLVAASGGVVTTATFERRAGNYLVITRPDGQSHVYMHMRRKSLLRKGDTVTAGQPIGEVGKTGRATGCHLHFELWTAPGWYRGGRAIDPLSELTRWDTSA